MTPVEIAVVVAGTALIAVLAWYFFAPRKAVEAQLEGDRQVIDIRVRGGYSPNLVRVTAGQPVRLRFDRQENSDCTARVVFPDLRTSASLAAFGTTTLDLEITEPGEYDWACGMNMLHGTLIAEAPGSPGTAGLLEKVLPEKTKHGQTLPASPVQSAGQVTGAARGVTGENRETARAVGVGPRLQGGAVCERAECAPTSAVVTASTGKSPAHDDA